jgi:hypothetical protein
VREHLEAAVENDDPGEARRLLADAPSPRRSLSTSTTCSIRGSARRPGGAEAYLEHEAGRWNAPTGVELPLLPLPSTAVIRQ